VVSVFAALRRDKKNLCAFVPLRLCLEKESAVEDCFGIYPRWRV
jgi:hypothetical protein